MRKCISCNKEYKNSPRLKHCIRHKYTFRGPDGEITVYTENTQRIDELRQSPEYTLTYQGPCGGVVVYQDISTDFDAVDREEEWFHLQQH